MFMDNNETGSSTSQIQFRERQSLGQLYCACIIKGNIDLANLGDGLYSHLVGLTLFSHIASSLGEAHFKDSCLCLVALIVTGSTHSGTPFTKPNPPASAFQVLTLHAGIILSVKLKTHIRVILKRQNHHHGDRDRGHSDKAKDLTTVRS